MNAETKKIYNAYHSQKTHAAKRNIDWHFTYETWLEWWGDDIVNRGRGIGKLVMARHGDKGPYHPDNVKKITHEENCSEGGPGKRGIKRSEEFRELKRQQAFKQHAEGRGNPYGCKILKNNHLLTSLPQTSAD